MSKIKRTITGWLDVDTLDYTDGRENMDVYVSNKPKYSPVLGPNGEPLEYEEIKVGF
jgi:hypothetical protein